MKKKQGPQSHVVTHRMSAELKAKIDEVARQNGISINRLYTTVMSRMCESTIHLKEKRK
jgi:predicted HicB family RNase H-like nuclease